MAARLPWQAGQAPVAAAGPAPSSDGDEGDAPDVPPATLFANLRAVLPSTSRADAMRAWDATRPAAGAAAQTVEERIARCIEALLDPPAVPAAGPSGRLAPDSAEVDGPRPAKRARFDKPAPLNLADDDDDDDEVQIVSPAKSKGKGKAREVISLDDDSSPVRRGHADGPVAGPSQPKPRAPSPIPVDDEPFIVPPSPTTSNVEQLVAILPDLDPVEARRLLLAYATHQNVVQSVADHLFNLDGKYPKAPVPTPAPPVASGSGASSSRKRKRDDADDQAEQDARDRKHYTEWRERPLIGHAYSSASLDLLMLDFATVPKPHIVQFYVPTYLELERDAARVPLPYRPLQTARRDKGKATSTGSLELDAERAWLHRSRAAERAEKDRLAAQDAQDKKRKLTLGQIDQENGLWLECQVCCDEVPFRKMAQCTEAHLFCVDCAKTQCELLIGQRRIDLRCMSDGCTAAFGDAELARFLSPTMIELLDKNRTEQYLNLADLNGFAKCPHCDFGMVIENPDEKLFRCGNETCSKVTCRLCKKADHIPKSCKEVEDEAGKEASLHKVAEAMSAAAIRKCPKPTCGQPYVKEEGCNKITCTFCRTLSCFVCGKIVTGYEHFANAGTNVPAGQANPNATCPLWDDSATRIYNEVEAARRAAGEEAKAAGPVTEADLAKLAAARPVARNPHGIVHYPPAGQVAANAAALQAHYAQLIAQERARLNLPAPGPGVMFHPGPPVAAPPPRPRHRRR